MKINPGQDIIDSRDVIERIEELRAEWTEATGDDPWAVEMAEGDWAYGLNAEDAHELFALEHLAADGEANVQDWEYGETLVRDSYFVVYAEQLAEDIGAVDTDAQWPLYHIDWEAAADELKLDYTDLEFDGEKYWVLP